RLQPSGCETAANGVQDMLARDPADGVGQVAEPGPMHELGHRRYKRRRLRIAFHDVPFSAATVTCAAAAMEGTCVAARAINPPQASRKVRRLAAEANGIAQRGETRPGRSQSPRPRARASCGRSWRFPLKCP